MFMIISRFREFRSYEGCIQEPECVLQATREYQNTCDMYVDFKNDRLMYDGVSRLKLEESYNKFKEWFKLNGEGKCPLRKDYKSSMERKLGTNYGTGNSAGWRGWAIKPLDILSENDSIANDD